MKRFWLWFGVFVCVGLMFAGVTAFFRDMTVDAGMAVRELIIGIVLGGCAIPLTLKALHPEGKEAQEGRKYIPGTSLPVVMPSGLILARGEACHISENIKIGKTKTVTTGRVTSHSGGSVRVAKGLSVRSGTSTSRTIRRDILDTVPGYLYVTNKRIVASSSKYNFDKPLSGLSSYTMYKDGFALQFGKDTFTILTREPVYVMTVLRTVIAVYQ